MRQTTLDTLWGGASRRKRVGIIGSAGRLEDATRMSARTFSWMVERARSILHETWGLERHEVILVSGGSVWSDHVAVDLFLAASGASDEKGTAGFAGLELFLPAPWTGSAFWEGRRDGATLNGYHRRFSRALGRNTLEELERVRTLGPSVTFTATAAGFLSRNAQIAASCDYLLAFSWHNGDSPKEGGGTRHTWDRCKAARKLHISLFASVAMPSPLPLPSPSPAAISSKDTVQRVGVCGHHDTPEATSEEREKAS